MIRDAEHQKLAILVTTVHPDPLKNIRDLFGMFSTNHS